eukprot:403374596
MKRRDFFQIPVLKENLVLFLKKDDNFLFNKQHNKPKIILTFYPKEYRKDFSNQLYDMSQSQMGSYSQITQNQVMSQIQSNLDEIQDQIEDTLWASDGYQKIRVDMQSLNQNLDKNFKECFEKLQKSWSQNRPKASSTLIVIYDFDFQISTIQNLQGHFKRLVDLVLKHFLIHSMNDRLTPEILQPPDDLHELQNDPEILTWHQYISFQQLHEKASKLKVQLYSIRKGLLCLPENDLLISGIEPIKAQVLESHQRLEEIHNGSEILTSLNDDQCQIDTSTNQNILTKVKEEILRTQTEEEEDGLYQQNFQANDKDPNFYIKQEYQSEDEENQLDLIRLEELSGDEEGEIKSHTKDTEKFTIENMSQRLKLILGADFNKCKTEQIIIKKKGRGKWHQVADSQYAFNVSSSNGDSVIVMGQVFIIQTPKDSISSRYRGYPMPVIEPPKEEKVIHKDPIVEMIEKQKSKPERVIEEQRIEDLKEEKIGCHVKRGVPFIIKTYLDSQEKERNRSKAIEHSLKYEEEYMCYWNLQQYSKQKDQEVQDSAQDYNLTLLKQEIFEQNTDTLGIDESYLSDIDNSEFKDQTLEDVSVIKQTSSERLQYKPNFYAQTILIANNINLKRAHNIRSTIIQIFKFGAKTYNRLSNQILLEKYDKCQNKVQRLRDAPDQYGIQKQKRQIKYYDKCDQFIKKYLNDGQLESERVQKQKEKESENFVSLQTLQRYRSWYRYLETRFHRVDDQNELRPTCYDVSNFFSFNHEFSLRLAIHQECRVRAVKKEILVKEEPFENQLKFQQNLSQVQDKLIKRQVQQKEKSMYDQPFLKFSPDQTSQQQKIQKKQKNFYQDYDEQQMLKDFEKSNEKSSQIKNQVLNYKAALPQQSEKLKQLQRIGKRLKDNSSQQKTQYSLKRPKIDSQLALPPINTVLPQSQFEFSVQLSDNEGQEDQTASKLQLDCQNSRIINNQNNKLTNSFCSTLNSSLPDSSYSENRQSENGTKAKLQESQENLKSQELQSEEVYHYDSYMSNKQDVTKQNIGHGPIYSNNCNGYKNF